MIQAHAATINQSGIKPEVRRILDQIDMLLNNARFDVAWDVYDVLAALRGPDQKEVTSAAGKSETADAAKDAMTIHIRNAAFPLACADGALPCAVSTSQDLYVPVAGRDDNTYYCTSSHYFAHVLEALRALGHNA